MTKPARRLPSLTALRSFEAVARHLSFTKAADELGVTQAAISRQVKALEAALSVILVVRGKAGNSLTDAGEQLFGGIHRGFDTIVQAIERISGSGNRQILNVSVAPFFSARWLTPRLEVSSAEEAEEMEEDDQRDGNAGQPQDDVSEHGCNPRALG